MAHIKHGGMNPRETAAPKPPKKELEHIRITEAENGGHIAEHHHTSYEHPPESHVFAKSAVKAPVHEGSLFHHLAKHMGIPHSVVEAKEESAEKTNSKAHEPDEQDELEAE